LLARIHQLSDVLLFSLAGSSMFSRQETLESINVPLFPYAQRIKEA
jgi:hypothetical protein